MIDSGTCSGARIVSGLVLLLLLAQWCLWAAKTDDVETLRNVIDDAAARHRSDKDTARRISELVLSERITEDTLATLQSRAPGGRRPARDEI